MKAISLWQPYASFIPLGLKRYETRSWATHYRGDLLICSTQKTGIAQAEILWKICRKHRDRFDYLDWSDLPRGYAIAIVTLTDCVQMTEEFIAQQSQIEIDCGDWEVGRWAWKLENIRKIKEPFRVSGKQGFFNVDVDLAVEVLEAVNV